MKIAIGSDHAGFKYKEKIKQYLKDNGYELHDFGAYSDASVDYPLFVRPVAKAVVKGEYNRGIVIGGSGNGEAIVANRVKGIRCALCWNTESALLARKHNDANMLSMGQRMLSQKEAIEILKTWLETPFDGGRHLRRIKQIDQKESLPQPPSRTLNNKASGEYDLLIAFRYIKYIEGKNSIEFQVNPGLKDPTVVHIPSSKKWNSVVPEWARNRREEILDRVKPKCTHLDCEWREY